MKGSVMSFLPRDTILANLDVMLGAPLIAPERIDDADLQAIWGYIAALLEEEDHDWRDGMPPFDEHAEEAR
jgi:hypothetical protein